MNFRSCTRLASLFVIICTSCFSQDHQSFTGNVNFRSSDARPIDAIVAIALQTHASIGIAFGEHQQLLCEAGRPFNINGESTGESLNDSVKGTGYSVINEQGVFVVKAPDLTPGQLQLLGHRFDTFSVQRDTTMAGMGAQLTGSLWLATGLTSGVGGSTLYSLSAQKYRLDDVGPATTEEIANRIVSLPSKGLWAFSEGHVSGLSKIMPMIKILSYKDDREAVQRLSCDQ
jgi:hypothetical protein